MSDTCGHCQGSGTVVTKYRRPDPEGTIKGHYGDMYPEEWTEMEPHDCPVCDGTGIYKKRKPRPEQGAIHFHIPYRLPPNDMSMDEIMDRLENR